jgi:hypothetical protein
MKTNHHDGRSSFHRTNYKRLLLFFLFATVVILLLTIARFDGGDHHLRNDVLFKSNMSGNRNGTGNELVFWSSDFHISPIADIKNIVKNYNVKVIDKSLSSHCHLSNTCQHDLRVIDRENGITLGKCPNTLINEFYESYKNDLEMKSVSAFLCTHDASLCELFMPFNKPMIIIASTRFDLEIYQLLCCLNIIFFMSFICLPPCLQAFQRELYSFYFSYTSRHITATYPNSPPFTCPSPHHLPALLPTIYLPFSPPFTCPSPHHLPALLSTVYLPFSPPFTCPSPHHLLALLPTIYLPFSPPFTCPSPHHLPPLLSTIYLPFSPPFTCPSPYHLPALLSTIYLPFSPPFTCPSLHHLPPLLPTVYLPFSPPFTSPSLHHLPALLSTVYLPFSPPFTCPSLHHLPAFQIRDRKAHS